MNILLINNNPVVSRLLALCTRDEHMILEEVESVKTIQHENYDVVFVDEGSYSGEVLDIFDMLNIGSKIFLSNKNKKRDDFDITIQKPFLPSQIIELLSTIDREDKKEVSSIFPLSTEKEEKVNESSKKEQIEALETSETKVLDIEELEKIKALLDMDEEIEEVEENLSDEEIEARKVEAIKEQLIADGLEIVEEEELVKGINLNDDVVVFSSEENVKSKVKKKKSSKKKEKKSKKKNIEFTEEELEDIEDAVQVAIATLKRKQMKKLLKGKEIEITIKLEDKA